MKDLKRSVTFHMVIIGVFMMLLLIPLSMIKDLIKEREQTNKEAMEEIRKSWAYTQEIAGPVLAVPYLLRDKDGNGTEHWLYFAPEKLKVKGDVTPTELYRSLYAFSVYTASVDIQGEFLFPDSAPFGVAFTDMLWDRALLSVQISDLKGIEEKATLVWSDEPSEFRPGIASVSSFSNGLHAPVKIVDYVETEKKVGKNKIEKEKIAQKIERLAFSIKLKFKGSASLFFAPLGKSTEVTLSSPWKSPNFEGAFLPTTRTVDNAGFNANWKVLNYNRELPESWNADKCPSFGPTLFGVSFFLEVNDYSKNDRTTKYGFLFILLTFVAFFFAEIFSHVKVHPIQYTLVGVALSIFYLLLISFSEHVGFNAAYLISSAAVTLLIALFTNAIYRSRKIGFLVGGKLVLLYGFIFVIIHLYNYALLAGSIGLFAILAVLMFFSRSVDWYGLIQQEALGIAQKEEEKK